MLKLLFFTVVRVGALVNIEVADLDLATCKILVDHGEGSKDRYILFPQIFSLVLRARLAAHPQQVHLFETQRWGPYTVRRVQQIVQRYREAAGLSAAVHPHPFRHQMLTFLTGQKLSDAQIQLLRHASKKSLEISTSTCRWMLWTPLTSGRTAYWTSSPRNLVDPVNSRSVALLLLCNA